MLQARLDDGESEREGWERLVRERLGWSRPGEVTILLPQEHDGLEPSEPLP